MKEGLVSIIMPSYNASRFIAESIKSVLAQTYQDWELLVVDDGSSDNSVDIINSYMSGDKRIKLFQGGHHGAAEARNIGIRQAEGRYVAFLDSDDVWVPTKLELQINFMKQGGHAFIFSNYYVMDEESRHTGKTVKVPTSISYHEYLRNTIIGCLTVIIDRKQTGYFEMPIIRSSHDMALWLLIMRRGFKAYGQQETLAGYRMVGNSNTSNKAKAAFDVWKVYREIEHLSLPYAAFCFCGYAIHAIIKRL